MVATVTAGCNNLVTTVAIARDMTLGPMSSRGVTPATCVCAGEVYLGASRSTVQ